MEVASSYHLVGGLGLVANYRCPARLAVEVGEQV